MINKIVVFYIIYIQSQKVRYTQMLKKLKLFESNKASYVLKSNYLIFCFIMNPTFERNGTTLKVLFVYVKLAKFVYTLTIQIVKIKRAN